MCSPSTAARSACSPSATRATCRGPTLVVGAGYGQESGAERDHLIGRTVDVDAEAQEAKPARLLRQSAQEAGHAVHVRGDDGAQVEG